jgi:hypothetical protein
VNPRRPRHPVRLSAVLAVAAVAALTGCMSTPSAKRVALDMIETLDISEAARDCMTEKVEGYSEEELDDIAGLAVDGNPQGTQQLQQFENDLATCTRGR